MSARRLEEFIGLIETAERVSGRRDSGSAYPKQVLKSSRYNTFVFISWLTITSEMITSYITNIVNEQGLIVTWILFQFSKPWTNMAEWSRPGELRWICWSSSPGSSLLVFLPNSPKTCRTPCLSLWPLLHLKLLHCQGSRRAFHGEKYDSIHTNGHCAQQRDDWTSLHC